MSQPLPNRPPVLLAGAGVTGSLAALELAHHGVPSLVLERSRTPAAPPDLLLISGRGMELLRRLGLAEAVRATGLSADRPVDLVWTRRLDDPPVLVRRLPAAADLRRAYASITDPIEPHLLISAPGLTARLRQALHDHPLVDLRTGWTLTDARTERDAVVATVIEAASGTRREVTADYLAGCDGAQSTVRRCAGLPMKPLGPPAPHVTVYFRSPALAAYREQPFLVTTGSATVVAGHDGDRCVAHLPISADDPAAFADPRDLLHQRLGPVAEPAEILAVVQRDGVPAVAGAYRRGRILLAGRSAHQPEPPGDDLDTGIGDAADLGWRLAAAVHGWGDDQLLAGYHADRRRRALLDRQAERRSGWLRARFRRLVHDGADRDALVDLLWHQPAPLDPAGTGPAEMVGRPGYRPPSFRLGGGSPFFDRLGPQFTLVDLTASRAGRPLVSAARARGIPIRHLPLTDPRVPADWSGRLLLVRPDQQVAWCGDGAPADCAAVLDEVTGTRPQVYENT